MKEETHTISISAHLGNVINTTSLGIYEAGQIQGPQELGLSFLGGDSPRSSHIISDKDVPLNNPGQTFFSWFPIPALPFSFIAIR